MYCGELSVTSATRSPCCKPLPRRKDATRRASCHMSAYDQVLPSATRQACLPACATRCLIRASKESLVMSLVSAGILALNKPHQVVDRVQVVRHHFFVGHFDAEFLFQEKHHFQNAGGIDDALSHERVAVVQC